MKTEQTYNQPTALNLDIIALMYQRLFQRFSPYDTTHLWHKLTLSGDSIEITKEGIRKGSAFISAGSVETVRWSCKDYMFDSAKYTDPKFSEDWFRMVFCDCHGYKIEFFYEYVYTDFDYEDRMILSQSEMRNNPLRFQNKSPETLRFERIRNSHIYYIYIFQTLVKAALNYIVPKICEKLKTKLDAGNEVKIQDCMLSRNALSFEEKGWFTRKRYKIPWNSMETEISGQLLTITDKSNSKIKKLISTHYNDNAVLLPMLSHILKQ